jgi:hypothetical protein
MGRLGLNAFFLSDSQGRYGENLVGHFFFANFGGG